ncbi:RNA polymerase sigma factor [Bizionia paragorgiae]|uniref:RNA polymerase sigma factor n=1 Tax=Bizionia paragorgiae TaxID=283786 RepID=UPI003A8C9B2D
MKEPLEKKFVDEINENLGIIHKVANIYFMDSGEREDVIQEMLYHLWKSFPSFQGNSKFSTWMYRVCLNTALTYLTKSKRNNHSSLSHLHIQIVDENLSETNEALMMLQGAIEKLSEINKGIVLLYLEDLSYEEIAQITGLSKSNVSVRLVRIKKELEKELKKSINH